MRPHELGGGNGVGRKEEENKSQTKILALSEVTLLMQPQGRHLFVPGRSFLSKWTLSPPFRRCGLPRRHFLWRRLCPLPGSVRGAFALPGILFPHALAPLGLPFRSDLL